MRAAGVDVLLHGEFWRLPFLQAHGRQGSASLQQDCHHVIATQLGQGPFSPRGILTGLEEESRTRGGQSGGVADQLQSGGVADQLQNGGVADQLQS